MVQESALIEARHKVGLYSIKELCAMFDCGRAKIDVAINSGKLRYISPNNKSRYIYLNDFLECSSSFFEIKKDNAQISDNSIVS